MFSLKSNWKEFQNGGYLSSSNPQFEIIISARSATVDITLQSSVGGPHCAMIMALTKEAKGRSRMERNHILCRSEYLLSSRISLRRSLLHGRYVVVCCLQRDNVNGPLELSVKKDPGVQSVRELPDYSRMIIKGSWAMFNGGYMSANNPQYRLRLRRKANVSLKLSDGHWKNSLFLMVSQCPTKKGARRKKLDRNEVIAQSPYLIHKSVSLTKELDPGKYDTDFLVIPCSGKLKMNFELMLETEDDVVETFEEIIEDDTEIVEDSCLQVVKKYLDPENPPFLLKDPTDELSKYCEANSCFFKDSYFPPNDVSINKNDGRNKQTFTAEWKRPLEFLDQPELYVDGVDIQDLKQGSVGDCWLCQGIATAAMNEKRITDLISQKSTSKYGFYVVKLAHDGEWKYILVDDYFPTNRSTFKFAKSHDENEIWVPLIEKAFAKIFGSYRSLANRSMEVSLYKLTGGDMHTRFHDKTDIKILWNEMMEYSKNKWLMGSCTYGQLASSYGLVEHHAYSVMGVYEHRGIKLVKMRNTWGHKEWTGEYSDRDMVNWSRELRRKVGYENKDDGIFFMKVRDFHKFFSSTTFCRITNELFPYSNQQQGDWKSEFGGTFNQIGNNPKIPLKIQHANTTVHCQLIVKSSKKKKVSDNSIIVHLVKGTIKRAYVPDTQKVASSKFMYSFKVKFETVVKTPGLYHILPCITNPTSDKYVVTIQSDKELVFGGKYQDPFPNVVNVSGKWNPCYGYLRWKNIQFSLFVNEECECGVNFQRTDSRGVTGLMLLLVKPGSTPRHPQIQNDQIMEKSEYLLVNQIDMTFKLSPSQKPYLLIPILQKKMAGIKYKFSMKSDKAVRVVVNKTLVDYRN